MKFKTPYADELLPMSTEERSALKADIKRSGQIVPIDVDEEGNILDGHNRYAIIGAKVAYRVIEGLSPAQKLAHVHRMQVSRRNMSPAHKEAERKRQQQIAKMLRDEDPKRWTQAKVAAELGVTQKTVSIWFSSDIPAYKATKEVAPDARVKLTTEQKAEAVRRVKAGESQAQVAVDFGVCQKTISNAVNAVDKIHSRDEDKARKTAHLKNSVFEVRRGDFREVLADITEASLVLTDPPYPKESLLLWHDLGEWASSALADDGVLVAYSGQMYLPEVLGLLSDHLDYWWCGALVHKGSGNLTPLGQPVRKVVNQWKPLVMFTKRGCGFERTFHDLVDGQGKQKEDHNWQQNEAEAAEIVERFTKKGELVVDPFAGSGGFCRAAHELGRIAVGAEILGA